MKPNYDASDTVIWGISPDKVAKQSKFAMKFDLPYSLLADTEHEVAEAYGVWIEKSMYGREYMGTARVTYIIDEKGIISEVIEKVDTKNHTDQILGNSVVKTTQTKSVKKVTKNVVKK